MKQTRFSPIPLDEQSPDDRWAKAMHELDNLPPDSQGADREAELLGELEYPRANRSQHLFGKVRHLVGAILESAAGPRGNGAEQGGGQDMCQVVAIEIADRCEVVDAAEAA